MQQLTLWEEKAYQPRKRRKRRRANPLPTAVPYSITDNDCQTIGHTLNAWDLLGCSTCMDCGVHVYCPRCTPKHPQDDNAIPVYCPHHEEGKAIA